MKSQREIYEALKYYSGERSRTAKYVTACVIDGVEKHIFKKPLTDSEAKASKKGAVASVRNMYGALECVQDLAISTDHGMDEMRNVYLNGAILLDEKLSDIRQRLSRPQKS